MVAACARAGRNSSSVTLVVVTKSVPKELIPRLSELGVKEFQCMGARPPHDHPHVYLDMGADSQILCPYCSTLYVHNSGLEPGQTDPGGCLVRPHDVAT